MFRSGENIIVVNGLGDGRLSDYTEIAPDRKLSIGNLTLWTMLNGFKLFSNEDQIIICRSSFKLSSSLMTIVKFAYANEKLTDLGVISIPGGKKCNGILYQETSDISIEAFSLTRRMLKALEPLLTDEVIFGEDFPQEKIIDAFRRSEKRLLRLTEL